MKRKDPSGFPENCHPRYHGEKMHTSPDKQNDLSCDVVIGIATDTQTGIAFDSIADDAMSVQKTTNRAKAKTATSGSAVVNSMMPVGFDDTDNDFDELSEMDMSLMEDDENPLEEKNFMGFAQQTIVGQMARHKQLVYRVVIGLFLCGFTVYMGFAIAYSVEGALAPMVFTGLVLFFWSYNQIVKHWGTEIYENFLYPMQCWVNGNWYWMKW